MSIRLRLALWCAVIFCGLLSAIVLIIYSIHVEAHYQEVDRALSAIADHYRSEIEQEIVNGAQLNQSLVASLDRAGPQLVGVSVGVLDPHGRTITGPDLPELPLVGSDPAASPHGPAAFTTIQRPAGRVRVHVVSVTANGVLAGYVQSSASLTELDRSIDRFRLLLIATVVGGVLVAAAGSFATAARALQPIADVTETARAITLSRGFGRRLQPTDRHDELGELARTFNEMLAALQAAHEAQRRFVDDAAHELRAPLTSIIGNLDLLDRAPDLPEHERAMALADVRAEAERLGRLTHDLLSLARADAGQRIERRDVDLDRVMVEVVRQAQIFADGLELGITTLESAIVHGDADRLRQLLTILVENAVHYTPAGGSIHLSLVRRGGQAIVAVEDTGIGIADADQPKVFDRFYRSDRARSVGGSGLGLAIAKWIAEAHGGQIGMESVPDVGTVFRVWLPLIPHDPSASSATAQNAIVNPSSNRHVSRADQEHAEPRRKPSSRDSLARPVDDNPSGEGESRASRSRRGRMRER